MQNLCEICSKPTKTEKNRFCSRRCSGLSTGYQKGNKPVNGFTKGHTPWHKGKKVNLSPDSQFKKGDNVGKQNHFWKGEKAGVKAKHAWVKRHKGKAKNCQICGITQKETAIDWANVDHNYKRNLEDYLELCRKCHRWYDREFNDYQMPSRW